MRCRNDRDESGGGTCVNADFVQHYEHWVNSPAGRGEIERCKGEGRQHPDMSNVPGRRVNVSGKAGDLLVWDRLTPHGSSINTSDEPRMVSRHDIAGIWVAFFSRCQRYRC